MIKRVTLTRSLRVAILALTDVIKKNGIDYYTINYFSQHINATNNSKDQNIVVNINEISREINTQVIQSTTEIERNKTVDVEKMNQ